MRISLLVSGNLGYKVLCEVYAAFRVDVIFTDKHSSDIINFCLLNKIPCYVGNPRKGKAAQIIEEVQVDVVLSVNYLFLIDKDIINWPKKYPINFHGSLLPKYRGRTPHVWAIINNEKKTGITAHIIDEGCDTGPIIAQMELEIGEADTGASVLEKYNYLYPGFVKNVLQQVAEESIVVRAQDHSKATYFGKRTPNDGQINWQWQKERIYNWVRAQANPYPGAFSFYEGNKIIINKIVYSDEGFQDTSPNGCILKVDEGMPIVKTQNGAIRILDKIESGTIIYREGNMFI